jgi:hypothetical protein
MNKNDGNKSITKRNIAAMIGGMFASMRASGLMAQHEATITRQKKIDAKELPPRSHGKATTFSALPGKRQQSRLARQLAKGMINANGKTLT